MGFVVRPTLTTTNPAATAGAHRTNPWPGETAAAAHTLCPVRRFRAYTRPLSVPTNTRCSVTAGVERTRPHTSTIQRFAPVSASNAHTRR